MRVAIHVGGEGIAKGREMAGGHASTFFERYCNIHQSGMHYVTSLITHGVFERFPDLRVMIAEFGFTWLPSVAWRLDALFSVLRMESPLVRRRPSEVIREHLRFSTQPFEHVVAADRTARLFESYPDLEHLLCFATDYPHWDADEPRNVAARLPAGWAERVFFGNASEFYGWPAPVAA
jgi:predicted TIM-barrel fold metal-dependent hydrolase